MATPGIPPWKRWPLPFAVLAMPRGVQFVLLFIAFFGASCSLEFPPDASVASASAGPTPRRLLVGWTVRKFFLAKTPETLIAERARSMRPMTPGCDYGLQFLYSAVLSAGKHKPSRSSLIDTSVEDVMVAFFRMTDLKNLNFPLQWLAIENALNRSHTRAIMTALRRQQAEQQDYDNDPDREKPLDLTVPEYTWMLGQQSREVEWFFDGNTFHKRGPIVVPEKLTDHDLGFMKSLPYNVVRVARGIKQEKPSRTVAHLIEELAQRGVTTATDFLLKTNFLDILFSTSVIDETFLQLDILSEYIANWEAFKANAVLPPSIPLGTPEGKLLETLTSKKSAREEYPKCPTMKCFVESVWAQRAEHPIDKESKQQNEEDDPKKKPPSEPFAQLQIKKSASNSLKLVAIGNSRFDKYEKSKGFWGRLKKLMRLNEFEATVKAMREWHQREGVDIALGVGDFLKPPGMLSVRDSGFKKDWNDVYVKDGGLDIPWYLVKGEGESMIAASAPFRYNYTRQDVHYHNPNWLHKAVITMVANLTTADGGSEDQEFTVHLISLDTWMLFGGTPFYDNIGLYQNRMIALSNTLFHSAKEKADWIIVQGHHPLLSTAPEAEEARLSYVSDLVKGGRARGPESRLVELLAAYQVDAYISAHDHALEYLTMSDIEKNSTLAFITSGGGTRIMSKTWGRGWLGAVRGRLFPLLCWSGRRIFYKLDPGGCKPSEKDQALAYKFYAPHGPNWKIGVKQRILHTAGFASIKITKDFLIVDFVSNRSGKPTGRKLHKQTNREARAVKFIDFWEDADLKLKELNIDHDAFEEENRERVASEIAFQTRTPILAERLRLYERELVEMYNEYQQLKTKKATYETMTAQKAAALEAQGENLRESELSEGMYEQTERIIELMYIIASDHTYMWSRYEELKEQRKGLPANDSKHAEALLKLEKKFADAKKKRREINKKYVEQGGPPTAADAERIRELVLNARILRRDMAELEQAIEREAGEEGGKPPEVEKAREELPAIKPIGMTVEARLERKKQQLKDHDRIMESISELPASEKSQLKEEMDMLKRQHEKLVSEVAKLEYLLNRKSLAWDRRPSELWEKRLQKTELEQTLKQLEAYKLSIINLPKVKRRTTDLSDAVTNIELQKMDIEEQLLELNDDLYNTQPTQLQLQFIAQMEKVRELSVLVESKGTMPAEALEDPGVKKVLDQAEEMLTQLQAEVESLDEAVRKELHVQDEAWVKRMIVRGLNMKELAEEFSIDIEQVKEEDAKARRADPQLQLDWVLQQEWDAQQRLAEFGKIAPELQERYAKDKDQIMERLEELSILKAEAEAALAARAEEVKDKAEAEKEDESTEPPYPVAQNEENVENESVGSTTPELLENSNVASDSSQKNLGADEGLESRRLASVMEWFQPKKEETPVKQLPKIDLGPKDPCEGEPMLYVVVKKAINAEYAANMADRCKKVFANRAHRAQRKFIGLFDDSGNSAFYETPHVHVKKGLKELFGSTRLRSFAELMATMKDRLMDVTNKIEVATFDQVFKPEEVAEGSTDEEFIVTDDE